MEKLKQILDTELGRQIYSFVKTFVAAFLAIALYANQEGIDVFTLAFIIPAMKSSTIVVLRNVYKLVTEK